MESGFHMMGSRQNHSQRSVAHTPSREHESRTSTFHSGLTDCSQHKSDLVLPPSLSPFPSFPLSPSEPLDPPFRSPTYSLVQSLARLDSHSLTHHSTGTLMNEQLTIEAGFRDENYRPSQHSPPSLCNLCKSKVRMIFIASLHSRYAFRIMTGSGRACPQHLSDREESGTASI